MKIVVIAVLTHWIKALNNLREHGHEAVAAHPTQGQHSHGEGLPKC